MERFGDELRLERERRQITIETICEVTRVSTRHIQALEAGDYALLPGGVFRKGILRNYLSVLDVDEASWIERFEASLRASGIGTETQDNWGEFAENVRRNRGGKQSPTRLRWVGVFAMIAILALAGWFVWRFVVHPHMQATNGHSQTRLALSWTSPFRSH